MRIWDGHCHLAGFPGESVEVRMAAMIALADRMGVERVCVFMGTNFEYDPTPEKMSADNEEVLRALEAWPDRVFGFVYLNPKYIDESLAELARCIENGPMVAVKLWVAQNCDTPEVDAIVEAATALKAPVFQHTWLKITGNLPGESTPMDLARLAKRHPDAAIICGHAGGDWELGIRAVRDCPNVSVDLGGGDPTNGFTEMAVRELGAERVLFGSDIGGRSYASQLAKVYGAEISEDEKSMIFSGNLMRVLTPILEAKGVQV